MQISVSGWGRTHNTQSWYSTGLYQYNTGYYTEKVHNHIINLWSWADECMKWVGYPYHYHNHNLTWKYLPIPIQYHYDTLNQPSRAICVTSYTNKQTNKQILLIILLTLQLQLLQELMLLLFPHPHKIDSCIPPSVYLVLAVVTLKIFYVQVIPCHC